MGSDLSIVLPCNKTFIMQSPFKKKRNRNQIKNVASPEWQQDRVKSEAWNFNKVRNDCWSVIRTNKPHKYGSILFDIVLNYKFKKVSDNRYNVIN